MGPHSLYKALGLEIAKIRKLTHATHQGPLYKSEFWKMYVFFSDQCTFFVPNPVPEFGVETSSGTPL